MFKHDLDPKALEKRMRAQLAISLQYLFDEFEDQVRLDPQKSEMVITRLKQGKVQPGVYARYYDLVFALTNEETRKVTKLANEIFELISEPVEFKIIPYAKKELGDDFERFPRLLFAEFSLDNPMSTPKATLHKQHREKLEQALNVIQLVDNAIYQEIKALLSCVVVSVHNSQLSTANAFGGVSSFMTWGATFINAGAYRTEHQAVEFFVHEITHCMLFGHSCQDALVLNSIDESYRSPLRSQLRPVDGIYHATLVCARIALFMQKWMKFGTDNSEHTQWLEARYESNKDSFLDGLSVLNEHAKLSKQGALFLSQAKAALI